MKLLLIILVLAIIASVIFFLTRPKAVPKPVEREKTVPPGTQSTDDETMLRPVVTPAALASARAKVTHDLPDEVLSDVLLDATPQEVAQMFAAVPSSVMSHAIAGEHGVHLEGEAAAEDLAKLDKLSGDIDELDIWNFDTSPHTGQNKKA